MFFLIAWMKMNFLFVFAIYPHSSNLSCASISVPYLSFTKPLGCPCLLSWSCTLFMHILFPACQAAEPTAVVALFPPPSSHWLTVLCHRVIPAHLFVRFPANKRWGHGEKAPMRPLFHLYKTFQESLPGCTFCQSRALKGQQQPRERGGRESE